MYLTFGADFFFLDFSDVVKSTDNPTGSMAVGQLVFYCTQYHSMTTFLSHAHSSSWQLNQQHAMFCRCLLLPPRSNHLEVLFSKMRFKIE